MKEGRKEKEWINYKLIVKINNNNDNNRYNDAIDNYVKKEIDVDKFYNINDKSNFLITKRIMSIC